MLKDRWLNTLVVFSVAVALITWLGSINQPLIDRHEFRQTQTALTALFFEFNLNGFLNYETPVLGAPWSIPFEFPFFQFLVAASSEAFGLPLSLTGRLVNILFGVACVWPALEMFSRFGFGLIAKKVFMILYFLSPLYLYWNRAFMIEGMALFFSLSSLMYFFRVKGYEGKVIDVRFALEVVPFLIFLALGLLVKATTALPVLLVMGSVGVAGLFRQAKSGERLSLMAAFIVMTISFAVLYFWTNHANDLKSLNIYGQDITSAALRQWNFGTLEQRFGVLLWGKVVLGNLVGVLPFVPVSILLIRSLIISSAKSREFLVISLSLSVLPILIFANLHIVHDYYQVSAQIFFLMAVAASVEIFSETQQRSGFLKKLPTLVLSLYIVWDISMFGFLYSPYLARYESPKVDIGRYISLNTDPNSAILIFGDGWSSAFPYHSKRRSLVRPYVEKEVLQNPSRYLGGSKLGAVVSSEPLSEIELKDSCGPSENLFYQPKIHLSSSIIRKLKELLPWLDRSKGRLGSDVKSWNVYKCG